jgi:iron complex outermembrane receptor protein
MSSKFYRRVAINSAAVAALLAFSAPVAAYAQEATHSFNIPSQDMASALRAYAKASRRQVVFDGSVMRGRTSQRVVGSFTADDGLRRLLSGAGVAARTGERGVLFVEPVAGDPPVEPTRQVGGDEPTSEATDVEAIVVTASRVQRNGFSAPTPTTVLGRDELQKTGASNIGQLMQEIPSFQPSLTPASTTISSQQAGGNFIDLRGLGPNRTLVLVDGRRHVATTADGAVDTNVIPSTLIDRVEVVTGGASAAWGSDAVAGVVNLILRKDLEGFEGEVHGGISSQGDNEEWGGALAWGTKFADDKGHFTIAGEAVDNKGVLHQGDRDWGRKDYQLIENPAFGAPGEPLYIVAKGAGLAIATQGGLILNGVNGGKQFNPDGSLSPFDPGTLNSGLTQVGGDSFNPGRFTGLLVPLKRENVFSRVSYDFTENLTGYIEGGYAHSRSVNRYLVAPFTLGNIAITTDNAFLSPTIRDQMIDAGEDFFVFGRYHTDIGFIQADDSNTTTRFVVGLDGKFGQTWKWNAYYQSGKTEYEAFLNGNLRPDRLAQAADAVADPITGDPVCRSTISDPTNGCVPINLFGQGAPSDAAIDYVTDRQAIRSTIKQQVAAFSVQGEPFSTWAGPVSIAAGGEYRKESVSARVDAVSAADGFLIGNPKALDGEYDVREGFIETVIPLLADAPFAKALDFNGAVRLTDYSTSGQVTTWKAGLSWNVNDQIRFRATRSRDIRAANLSELFTASQLLFTTVSDPLNNDEFVTIQTLREGNPNLKPEEADTTTFGVVFQPDFIPGFRASIDFYDLKINGVISTIAPQDIINRCADGNTALCSLIERENDAPAGELQAVHLRQVNLSELKTRGIDFEASYVFPVERLVSNWSGDLSIRFLATYVDRFIIDDGITANDFAGDLGSDVSNPTPKWRWNINATYRNGPLTAYVAGRYVGGGKYNHNLEGLISDNEIDSAFYTDASLAWSFINADNRSVQLYGVVRNLFDVDPPVNPSSFFLSPLAANPVLHDTVGRTFTVGLRFKY